MKKPVEVSEEVERRGAEGGAIYRFSCNSARDTVDDSPWDTVDDSPWDIVEAAASGESGQYDVRSVRWNSW